MLGGKAKLLVIAIGSLFDDIANAINVGLKKLGLDLINFGEVTGRTKAMIEEFFRADDIDTSTLRSALDTVIIGTGHMEQSMIDYLARVDELLEQEKRADQELAKFAHLKKLRMIEAQDQIRAEQKEVSMLEKSYMAFGQGFVNEMQKQKNALQQFEEAGKKAFTNFSNMLADDVAKPKP